MQPEFPDRKAWITPIRGRTDWERAGFYMEDALEEGENHLSESIASSCYRRRRAGKGLPIW